MPTTEMKTFSQMGIQKVRLELVTRQAEAKARQLWSPDELRTPSVPPFFCKNVGFKWGTGQKEKKVKRS